MVLYCERCAGFLFLCQFHNRVFDSKVMPFLLLSKSIYWHKTISLAALTKQYSREREKATIDLYVCNVSLSMCQRNDIDNTLNMIWLWHVHQHSPNHLWFLLKKSRASNYAAMLSIECCFFFYSKMCANLSCAIEINAVDLALILSCYSFETWSNWIQLNKEFNKNLRAE